MTTSPELSEEIKQVFVGSTVLDLEKYREHVKNALNGLEVAVFLGEEWNQGFQLTLKLCRDKVLESDAYIGIFASWYGTVFPKYDKSITHLEFLWALEKWQDAGHSPMVVLMPKQGSHLEKKLSDAALKLLETEDAVEHARRLEAFHKEIKGPGRTVAYFSTIQQLRERALCACSNLKTSLLESALDAVARVANDAELGQLGRSSQLEAVRNGLAEAETRSSFGMLAAGGAHSGQRRFLNAVKALPELEDSRVIGPGPPSFSSCEAMLQWIVEDARAPVPEENTAAHAATALAKRLEDEQIVVLIDGVHAYPGGVVGFQRDVWGPLATCLEELAENRDELYPLVVIASTYSGEPHDWNDAVRPADSDLDEIEGGQLVLLPSFEAISKAEVITWAKQMGVPNKPRNRLKNIAAKVLVDPSGVEEGVPDFVFGRLKEIELWPEEE